MRIACVSHREWAISIYNKLKTLTKNDFLIIDTKKHYDEDKILSYNPDLILFYGWSWIVGERLINKFYCIMLHPAPLPKYRGGSPIQNQIINGEKNSAVTLFLMDNGMDTGPILKQEEFKLNGNLSEIFERICNIGYKLTIELFNEGLKPLEQNHSIATTFKRRSPSQSEITLEELQTKSSEYLYNKIRMLQNPYPNAYIKTSDGKKLILTQSSIKE